MRLDDGQQFGPRDDFLQAGAELLAAGGLPFGGKLGVGKTGGVGPAGKFRKSPHASPQKTSETQIKSAFP